MGERPWEDAGGRRTQAREQPQKAPVLPLIWDVQTPGWETVHCCYLSHPVIRCCDGNPSNLMQESSRKQKQK